MLIQQNEKGEIKGMGPQHACPGFGAPGHDYNHCKTCWSNYERYLAALAVSRKAAEAQGVRP